MIIPLMTAIMQICRKIKLRSKAPLFGVSIDYADTKEGRVQNLKLRKAPILPRILIVLFSLQQSDSS